MSLLEGFTEITAPMLGAGKGFLSLDPEFNSEQWVGKWVLEGPAIQMAAQREPIIHAGVAAPGWAVWKNPDTGKSCQRTLSSGKYVLLCRPRLIQEQINVLYANASRMRIVREVKGDTVAGDSTQSQQGILSTRDLAIGVPRVDQDDRLDPSFERGLSLTPLPTRRPEEAADLQTS